MAKHVARVVGLLVRASKALMGKYIAVIATSKFLVRGLKAIGYPVATQ